MDIKLFRNINKFFLFILFVILGMVLNEYNVQPTYQILNLILMIIVGMWYFNFEIFHPFVWLTPFIFIYNISVIALDILDIRETQITQHLLLAIYIAIFAMFIFFVFFSKKKKNKNLEIANITPISFKYLNFIYYLLSIIIIINIVLFLKSGITSKSQLSLSGSYLNLGYIYQLYVFISFFYIIQSLYVKKILPKKVIFITISLVILIALAIGERDALFSLILLLLYLYYIYKKPPKKVIYILGFLLIFTIPLFGALKNVFSLGIEDRLANTNFLIKIFQGEFLSAGRNFEVLFQHINEWYYFYGETILWDFLRTIIPPFVYRVQNPVGWFNRTFLPDVVAQGRGHGFTLIGEGYINFGYIGVFIWFFLLAFILNLLYRRFDKNLFLFSLYIYMIPTAIYIQRADLSNFFSPLLKHGLMFVLIVYLGKYFIKRRNKYAT